MSAPQQASAFNNQIPPRYTIKNITAAYTVTGADYGLVLNVVSGSNVSIALAPAASVGVGFNCTVWNSSTANIAVTLIPNDSETIDAKSSIILRPNEGVQILSNGSNWQTNQQSRIRTIQYNYSTTSSNSFPVASGSFSLAIGIANSLSAPVTASSSLSTAIGTNSNGGGSQAVTGSGAMALGGSYASGTDSFAAANADNTGTYGAQGLNSVAIGWQAKATASSSMALGTNSSATSVSSLALGRNCAVSSSSSTAIGMNSGGSGSTATTGLGAMALGGSYASGTDSFAAAVANNTSSYGSAGTSSISIGSINIASGNRSVAIGSGNYASNNGAVAIGTNTTLGWGAYAQAADAIALGDGAKSLIIKKLAIAGYNLSSQGAVQTGILVLTLDTTSATAAVLTSNSNTASTNNQIILPNNSAYTFSILVVARQQAAGGTASAAWQITGLIRQEGTAASTTLVASTVTTISNVPAWTIAVSADTTNGGLAITATGAASTNIRWVATAQTSEVTYA